MATSPTHSDAPALLGPPWRPIRADYAHALAKIAPHAPRYAWAVASPLTRRLERVRSENAAVARAVKMALDGDGVAYVYHRVVQLKRDRYLWLPGCRLDVQKALNPNDAGDFAVLIDRLARDLQQAARGGAQQARRAVNLDLPWEAASRTVIERTIRQGRQAIERVVDGTGMKAMTRFKLPALCVRIADRVGREVSGRSITVGQARQAAQIGRDQRVFIEDEYKRRADGWEQDARLIIFEGARQQLPDQQIATRLRDAFERRLTSRDAFYFQMVASAVATRIRSLAKLFGMVRAGMAKYKWVAILDSHTCDICRFLHGQEFDVQAAIARIKRASRDPDRARAMVRETPWYRVVGNEIRVGAGGAAVAVIQRSGVGSTRRGRYGASTPLDQAGGTPFAPAHGGCRCHVEPVA